MKVINIRSDDRRWHRSVIVER